MATTQTRERPSVFKAKEPERTWSETPKGARRILYGGLLTALAAFLVVLFLAPLAYMGVTSLKTEDMIADPKAPILPSTRATMEFEGENIDILRVPIDGDVRDMGIVQPGRQSSVLVDPDNVEAGTIVWEGNWRTLDPAFEFNPQWGNFSVAWERLDFLLLLRNTLVIALVGMVGTLVSSTLVAYGLSRFRIPWKKAIFIVLIATIILPRFVTLVPTYALFFRIGWVGTWLPLIVPHFFANAYNVFLLRQYFLTIPKELDEAATVDGANPLQTLWHVFLPQAIPALVAVCLFHFYFAWNDFFEPLIYLSTRPDLQPISVGLRQFNTLFDSQPHLIQAGALLSLFVPVIIFIFAQRVFLKGIDLAGVQK
jgi:multiple sugar transport system permease protein